MLTWPTIVFDDETGVFKYRREGKNWTEERTRVMAKWTTGISASGFYIHNDVIFSAIQVNAWASPPSFGHGAVEAVPWPARAGMHAAMLRPGAGILPAGGVGATLTLLQGLNQETRIKCRVSKTLFYIVDKWEVRNAKGEPLTQ